MAISFKPPGKKHLPLSRSFLLAVLFNCESQQIWKLRELSIKNADEALTRGGKNTAPPPELKDEWVVSTMMFASRQPDNRKRR